MSGAFAGSAVHVVTVNDYLPERDAETMGPISRVLGLSVGCVKQGMDPASRQAAYRSDVTYCSNKEIAEKFSLSEDTVKHHLTSIFDKLGVSNRLELALFAVNHRLTDPL